jgi:inner membrane protein
MEPITHFLTGACIGRSGLNRKTACATLAAVLAAEAADLDVVWGFAGPIEGLKHHRGITHTFIAAPIIAAAAVGAAWLFHCWRMRGFDARQKLAVAAEPGAPVRSAPQPISWLWLYLSALIAALSHILLDWTNNYGVRPFFPFNARWYAGSFVFIAEPVIWALLLAALIIPGLLGLTDREINSRGRTPFRGRGWAIFALTGMVLLWCLRYSQHAQAEALLNNTQVTTEPTRRIGVEPYPFNPFHWHAILDTANFFQTAEVNTRTGNIDSEPQTDQIFKPAVTPAIEAAKRTELGRVYLDWASWAVVRDLGPIPIPGIEPPRLTPGRSWTTVQFTDLRFGYDFRGSGRPERSAPLGAAVYIADGREDAGGGMGGREQK